MFELLWAPDESQPRFSHRSFLGLQHDCSHGHWGMITFWPMHRLPNSQYIISVARQACFCGNAAATLYRVIDFLGMACSDEWDVQA